MATKSKMAIRAEQRKKIEAEASSKGEAEQKVREYDIYDIGKRARLSHHVVVKAIHENMSVADFTEQALDTLKANIYSADKEKVSDRFSMRQFILDKANGKESLGAEREIIDTHSALESDSPYMARGVLLPGSVFQKKPTQSQRLLVAGTDSAGGYTIDDQLLRLVDPLDPNLPITERVTKNYTSKPFSYPIKQTQSSASFVGETIAPSESDITFGQVKQRARTILGFTTFSRELLTQSSLDVENLVRQDLSDVITFSIERALLKATGTGNEPKGLENNSEITTITRSSADSISVDECLQVEEALGLANVVIGDKPYGENNLRNQMMMRRFSLNWICSSKLRRLCKKTAYLEGGSGSLWDVGDSGNSEITIHGSGSKRDPKILEYDAHVSTFSNADDMWLGNWSDLVLTYFSSIDVIVDQNSLSTQGLIRVTVSQMVDFFLRHNSSIVRLTA